MGAHRGAQVAAALGVLFGLVLGMVAARGLLGSFSSDLFRFHLHLGWWALSQWPAARAVRRMDIARVVRERAT